MYKNLAAIIVAQASTVRETPCLAAVLPPMAVAP